MCFSLFVFVVVVLLYFVCLLCFLGVFLKEIMCICNIYAKIDQNLLDVYFVIK